MYNALFMCMFMDVYFSIAHGDVLGGKVNVPSSCLWCVYYGGSLAGDVYFSLRRFTHAIYSGFCQ
jgi:hypothetical protein